LSVAVYTAIVGGPYKLEQRHDVPCFTDAGLFRHSVLEAKRYKVLGHLFFPDEFTIWVDGNIKLARDPGAIVAEYLGSADLAVFTHPVHKTVWQEFGCIATQPRFKIPYLQSQLEAQFNAYRAEGLPEDTPCFECNMLIRRRTPAVERLMEAWWAQICRWQWRDQVSFPYALWKAGRDVKVNVLGRETGIREDWLSFIHDEQHG